MAFEADGLSKEFRTFLAGTNYIFTTVFICEASLKIVAFGDTYLDNAWNKFDFFVVVSSIFDIIMENAGSSMEFLTVAP